MLRAVVAISLLALLFGLVTFIALEGQEVARLKTRRDDGTWRTTHVWVAREDGTLWIEAATPDRSWYRELLARPRVEIELGGKSRAFRARPLPGDAGHRRIRSMLREKYGVADVWVGLLQDTSQSIAVAFDPEPSP